MKEYKAFKSMPVIQNREFNENYVPYVTINTLFTASETDRINILWDEEAAMDGMVSNTNAKTGGVVNYEKRKAKEMYLEEQSNEWIYDKIASISVMTNAVTFRMDLTGFQDKIRMIKYEAGDFFDWHMDYGRGSRSNRKLVVCIQLSEKNEYEGGQLQLLTSDYIACQERGSAVIFPSYILHRVTPLISGSRKSMVALISGPSFR